MKQFLQGAGCITALIIITAVIAFSLRSQLSVESLGHVITFCVMLGAVVLGYVYKRWNGPLIFASDGKAHVRLLYFLLGVGLVFGPVKLYINAFPVEGISPVANLILLLVSVPLAGASVLGAMLIGSVFYKREPTWL